MSFDTYVGLDPSLTGTGVCVLSNSGELLHISTINTKNLRGYARLEHIAAEFFDRMWEHATGKIVVGIEGFSFGSKGRSVFDLGMLGGILRMGMYQEKIPFTEIPPTTLKKFVTGLGNVGKPQMLEMTFRNFGIGSDTLKDDNQVDAHGLAHLVRCKAKSIPLCLKKRQEALDKFELDYVLKED